MKHGAKSLQCKKSGASKGAQDWPEKRWGRNAIRPAVLLCFAYQGTLARAIYAFQQLCHAPQETGPCQDCPAVHSCTLQQGHLQGLHTDLP